MSALNSRPFFVHKLEHLTQDTFLVRFDRHQLEFKAGQYLLLGPPGTKESREYSIYSGAQAPYLEVLVKQVEEGLVSPLLSKLKEGEPVSVQGPFGYFTLDTSSFKENPHFLLVATGTGVSPFHSFLKSFAKLSYTLVHGVRQPSETYKMEKFPHYQLCLSRPVKPNENSPNGALGLNKAFDGRVTTFLPHLDLSKFEAAYLCGNCQMIYEVFDFLQSKGFPLEKIHTEVYF